MRCFVFTIRVVNKEGDQYGAIKRKPYQAKSVNFHAIDLSAALKLLDHHCVSIMRFADYYIEYIYSEPIEPINFQNFK